MLMVSGYRLLQADRRKRLARGRLAPIAFMILLPAFVGPAARTAAPPIPAETRQMFQALTNTRFMLSDQPC